MIHTTREDEMPTTTERPKTRKAAKLTPGTTIDTMWELREKKRALEASVKDVESQIADLESKLMEDMQANGVDKMTGKHASVSITSTVVANVEDWDAFWAYIHKMKYGHLLQRRVSDPAYRELLDLGKKIPGTQPFTKKRLNLRALSS